MDELDHNLLDAWNRVFERCRRDPREARRRYDRMHADGIFDRPPRAWCVALRASDTRLDEWVMEPEAGYMRARMAHEIEVDGATLSGLCGPVDLRYPGLPLREAAAKLGRDPASLSKWLPIQIGKTRADKQRTAETVGIGRRRWAEFYAHETGRGVFNVRYVPAGAAGRSAGMEVPVVWCDHLMDPGGHMGRPPSKWWGTLWRYLADEVPNDYGLTLVREPVLQPYAGGERFRGWQWRCPGLTCRNEPRCADDCEPRCADADSTCGRLVRTLYAPLPVRTVGEYFGITEGLQVEGLSGAWLPGVMDRWAGRRSLACERCWRIKRQTFTNSTGWNELVTYLTGGLLYGHEVEKPSGFAYERRRKYAKRARKKHRPKKQGGEGRVAATRSAGVV